MLTFSKGEVLSLKNHPDYAEKWVRDRLAEDPSLLGFGPLLLRDVERTQPRTGRLDLLFSDPLDQRRYEVELMLGQMDESHVIRALEYWDSERRRTPHCDHYAVLVAEQIAPRFIHILTLFAPVFPIIAVQLVALQVNEYLTLQFFRLPGELIGDHAETRVLPLPSAPRRDRPPAAPLEVDHPNLGPALLDECQEILRSIDPSISLDHSRDTVILTRGEYRSETISFFPHRDFLGVKARAPGKEEWLARLERAGIVVLAGGPARKRTHFRLTMEQIRRHRDLLRELFQSCLRDEPFFSQI